MFFKELNLCNLCKSKKNPCLIIVCLLCCLCSCDEGIQSAGTIDGYPDVFPDYKNVTIPVNIAPLNFDFLGECEKMEVTFSHEGKILYKCRNRRHTRIPEAVWRSMLQQATGGALQVQVYARQSGKWNVFQPFNIHVMNDSIDPYIAYRLIEPGYESWDQMGIYQRNLSTFDESPIITNGLIGRNCVNCHSFHDYRPDRMMFHLRGERFAGTFLLTDKKMERVNTKTEHAVSAGTYPMWHPSGDFIAFSVNVTRQVFHTLPGKKIEVYDLESDLAVWDVKNGSMLRDARFTTKDVWETFPVWSPDGNWLYYCFAEKKNMPLQSEQLKYGLCRVEFHVATGRFGERIDTIINPATSVKSVSFPRISPDGRYLLYTASAYATFPIWHKEADLEMIDLSDESSVDMQAVNSTEADSYHAWSSNGRWIVFSSRRIDGLYTRPFFAYFDSSGQIHKPFLLPQSDPEKYALLLKSYNIPEFVKGKVELNPYKIRQVLSGETSNLKEINHEQ